MELLFNQEFRLSGKFSKTNFVILSTALGSLRTNTAALHPRTSTARLERKFGHDAGVSTFNTGQLGKHVVGKRNCSHGGWKHRARTSSSDGGRIYRLGVLVRRWVSNATSIQPGPCSAADRFEHVYSDVVVLRFR